MGAILRARPTDPGYCAAKLAARALDQRFAMEPLGVDEQWLVTYQPLGEPACSATIDFRRRGYEIGVCLDIGGVASVESGYEGHGWHRRMSRDLARSLTSPRTSPLDRGTRARGGGGSRETREAIAESLALQ